MFISIFGLGYVGIVSAGCLASMGHKIVGVDINPVKTDMLNEGVSPIIEPGVPELFKEAKEKGLLTATLLAEEAIEASEISIVCVGTPSRANGSLNTTYLINVCKQIGSALENKQTNHVVVFRSTMLPGSMRELIIPVLEEASGKRHNEGFSVAFNPEFLRESTAVYDFFNPPKTVVGADSEEIAGTIMSIYDTIPGPKIKTKIETAEMVKYIDNNFHALKITFANEIGQICKKIGLDSHEVMDIFIQDKKLNISPAYLKPGFAFGGSCLPKDLRAINYLAKMMDLEVPLLNALLPSNNIHIVNAIKKIISFEKGKIGFAGLSFKAGTDDLRESPIVEVVETLIGKGYDILIFDRNVSASRLIGANKEYINLRIPHISSLMVDSLDELLDDREVIVIGNNDSEFKRILAESRDDQIVYDLVRIDEPVEARTNYEGICW